MPDQNFKNHSRLVTGYHFIAYPILLAVFIASLFNLCHADKDNCFGALLITGLAAGTLLIAFFTRAFSLKAQDRAIRAEENLRYFSLTGKLHDKDLRISQIIALRFAPDEELKELSAKALAENMSPKAIKAAIASWKADHHRV